MKKSVYHLLIKNCDHVVNYAQSDHLSNQQTKLAGAGLACVGTAMATTSKNGMVQGLGLLILIGVMALTVSELDKSD